VNWPASYQAFIPLPSDESLRVVWPTPGRVFARTRVNPDYGKPGWTRDCGRRFHRGCDIAPVHATATGQTTVVEFTDCATGKDFPSTEPTFVPHDPVGAVCAGTVVEAVTDAETSDFGKHVVLEHRWPDSGTAFYTLYGHLAEVAVSARVPVCRGQRLGTMGQTSRNADARNWMLVAPHLHFEVRAASGEAYDPIEFLRRFAV
jgi:murein DD-endopeptidase MepM/ murein hydrolase activator NlpD